MEEGYERKSGKEIINFFWMSKGSSAEAFGRYKRLKSVLLEAVIEKRTAKLAEKRAMHHSLIQKWN